MSSALTRIISVPLISGCCGTIYYQRSLWQWQCLHHIQFVSCWCQQYNSLPFIKCNRIIMITYLKQTLVNKSIQKVFLSPQLSESSVLIAAAASIKLCSWHSFYGCCLVQVNVGLLPHCLPIFALVVNVPVDTESGSSVLLFLFSLPPPPPNQTTKGGLGPNI